MDRIVQTYSELSSADIIGRSLCTAPSHLIRLVKIFLPSERSKLLEHAFRSYKTIDTRAYSMQQFIAYMLLTTESPLEEEEREFTLVQRGLTPLQVGSCGEVRIETLSAQSQALLGAVRVGEDAAALAQILSRTVIGDLRSLEGDVVDVLARVFQQPITRPELAAGVARCLSFNAKLTQTFRVDAELLTACARLIPGDEFDASLDSDCGALVESTAFGNALGLGPGEEDRIYGRGWDEHNRAVFYGLVDRVDELRTDRALVDLEQMQSELRGKLDLATRFRFVESPYGVLVPVSQCQLLSQDFAKLVESAKEDKAALLRLSPRGFEEFIADLFKAMGYEVQLTKTTRDGGADLVCMRNQNGIPFRLAVEVKRYKDSRPITVGLVRSFVGSNRQFDANKLLYVTTSFYTRSALEFADKYASHLLALKDYEQMREWCDEVGKETWKLLV